MKSHFPLLAFAFVATFALHWSALHPAVSPGAMPGGDWGAIVRGYRAVPNVWMDGLSWWHGPWINQHTPYFRPLSSYLHWFEVDLFSRYGWTATTVINLVLFATMAFWAGAVCLRYCRVRLCAYVTILIVAVQPLVPPIWATIRHGGPLREDVLSWLPYGDNMLCLCFFIPAVLLLDIWNETRKPFHFIISLCLGLCSGLSKEYGYVYPLFVAAIIAYRNSPAESARRIRYALVPFALIGAVAWWRHHVIFSVDRVQPLMPLANIIAGTGALVRSFHPGAPKASLDFDFALIALGSGIKTLGIIFVGLYLIWRFRRCSVALLMLTFTVLSAVPLIGLMWDSYHYLYVGVWLCSAMFYGAIHLKWRSAGRVVPARPRAKPVPRTVK